MQHRHHARRARAGLAAVVASAIAATLLTAGPAPAAPAPEQPDRPAGTAGTAADAAGLARAAERTAGRAWRPRPEQYPGTVTRTDLTIPMSDGLELRGDLVLPADASGKAVPGRWPVIVTITAYNKTVLGGSDLGGSSPDYLVKRGYAQLTVDARGTGSSPGQWCAFCRRENQDAGEIMTWAHRQPWSNGRTGMSGPSYMGISQINAAAANPPGLKAIFPAVPGADVYRDVVASGGALDVGFIPLWLGLVTTTGIIPPAYGAQDPAAGMSTLVDHALGAGTFTAPLLLGAMTGGEPALDGDFYAQRSPINVIDKVKVPAFFVSGQYDLFQRGTPLLFENLQRRGVPTKMVVGPWDHIQASGGTGMEEAGHGSLAELQLRWFDRWVKGRRDRRMDRDIAPLTYFEQGTHRWSRARRWMRRDLRAAAFRLSGTAVNGVPGGLTRGRPEPGTSPVLPLPAGPCTRSANQWTAGFLAMLPLPNPCLRDNRVNDLAGIVFETAPMKRRLRIHGPINARLFTSTPAGDGMLSVAVSDVAPDGTVSRLTGGWQMLSHRAVDQRRTRRLDGRIVQVHHPFTAEAKTRLAPGEVAPIDVEVFPTHARIMPGHRLRIAVQAFDLPHLLPTLVDLAPTLVPMTIHTSAEHRSVLTVPVIGR